MRCQWILWCETSEQRKAARLLERAENAIGCAAEEICYQHDPDIPGLRASFKTTLQEGPRESCIVEAMALCERIGAGWVIEGSVHAHLSFFSQQLRIVGICSCECYLIE